MPGKKRLRLLEKKGKRIEDDSLVIVIDFLSLV
jgi:hypothetical protein